MNSTSLNEKIRQFIIANSSFVGSESVPQITAGSGTVLSNDFNSRSNLSCQANSGIFSEILLAYAQSVRNLIRNLHSRFRVLYLIGSTWIHFGHSSQMKDVSTKVLNNFGSLVWDDDLWETFPADYNSSEK